MGSDWFGGGISGGVQTIVLLSIMETLSLPALSWIDSSTIVLVAEFAELAGIVLSLGQLSEPGERESIGL